MTTRQYIVQEVHKSLGTHGEWADSPNFVPYAENELDKAKEALAIERKSSAGRSYEFRLILRTEQVVDEIPQVSA